MSLSGTVVFFNAQADDSLNIKNSDVEIVDCAFENNSSDAFDGDWVTGKVSGSIFRNNGGDGIDLSGATLVSQNNVFDITGDKAVSAGENSRVIIANNVIKASEIGVASKDTSLVTVLNTFFLKNKIIVNAYRKKQIFSGGNIKIYNSVFSENREIYFMDQISKVYFNGVLTDHWNPVDKVKAKNIFVENVREHIESDTLMLTKKARKRFKGQAVPLSEWAREDVHFSNSVIGLFQQLKNHEPY